MERPPIFLVGCMRSGTTLLSRLISAHPQIVHLRFELLDVWTELGNAPCEGSCEYRDASHFSELAQTQMTDFFKAELKRSKSLRKHVRRAYYNLRHGHSRITYDWENAIVLNKSPHLMNKVGYVNSLFPDAHFIFIIRDIYAHSASQKYLFEYSYKAWSRQRYVPSDERGCWSYKDRAKLSGDNVCPGNFERIPEMWFRLNMLALNEIDKIDPARVSIVTYENLVLNQQAVLTDLYERLPLDSSHNHIIPSISQRVIGDKNTTTTGDSLTKWKNQLSEDEKDSIRRTISANQTDYDAILKRVGRTNQF